MAEERQDIINLCQCDTHNGKTMKESAKSTRDFIFFLMANCKDEIYGKWAADSIGFLNYLKDEVTYIDRTKD